LEDGRQKTEVSIRAEFGTPPVHFLFPPSPEGGSGKMVSAVIPLKNGIQKRIGVGENF
jgi:hypothetical protein